MDFSDKKLDSYISNIKNTESSSDDILSNYKKATRRLDVLKKEYNKLAKLYGNKDTGSNSDTDADTNDSDDDTESDARREIEKESSKINKMNIEELIAALEKIKLELETNLDDIDKLIITLRKYNLLSSALKKNFSNLENKIYKVESNRKEITLVEIKSSDII